MKKEQSQKMSEVAPTAYAVLEFVVKALVNEPDAVNIEVTEEANTVYMDVMVADDDRGRVIGRRGRTANTIRTLVNSASLKDDKVVEVDFLDG